MIVVDANLVVDLHVAGQRTRKAEAVLARDPTWAAPLLWRSEFRNVLAGLVRRKALAVEDAIRITGVAEEAMRGREYAVVSHEVLWLGPGRVARPTTASTWPWPRTSECVS